METSYATAEIGSKSYVFSLSASGCGTEVISKGRSEVISNTLIFQMDPHIQEWRDSARRISCIFAEQYARKAEFKPFRVSKLNIIMDEFEKDNVKCWMEIKIGNFPKTQPLSGAVRIGNPLSLEIYLQDDDPKVDLGIQDCWAYSNHSGINLTKGIQLSDENGCPLKRNLISRWGKQHVFIDSRRTLVAYSNISAFKFPDDNPVSILCNLQICYGSCKSGCNPDKKEPDEQGRSFHSKTLHSKLPILLPRVDEKLLKEKCFAGSDNPECKTKSKEENSSEECSLGSKSSYCEKSLTKSKFIIPQPKKCKNSIMDYACKNPISFWPLNQLNISKKVCHPRISDPHCHAEIPKESVTSLLACSFGSNDSNCSKTEKELKKCSTYSENPLCFQSSKLSKSNKKSATLTLGCILNPQNPKCRKKIIRNCQPSEKCRNIDWSETTALIKPESIEEKSRPICSSSSQNSQCVKLSSNKLPSWQFCLENPTFAICKNLAAKVKMSNKRNKLCLSGSNDPLCSERQQRRRSANLSTCFGSVTDPRCLSFSRKKPVCNPNSKESYCKSFTKSVKVMKGELICKKGSQDRKCDLFNVQKSQDSAETPNCKSNPEDLRCKEAEEEISKEVKEETSKVNIHEYVCGHDSSNPKCLILQSKQDYFSKLSCKSQPDNPICLMLPTQNTHHIANQECNSKKKNCIQIKSINTNSQINGPNICSVDSKEQHCLDRTSKSAEKTFCKTYHLVNQKCLDGGRTSRLIVPRKFENHNGMPDRSNFPVLFETSMPKVIHNILTYSIKPILWKSRSKSTAQNVPDVLNNKEDGTLKCWPGVADPRCQNAKSELFCGPKEFNLKCSKTVPHPITCKPGSTRNQCLSLATTRKPALSATTHSSFEIPNSSAFGRKINFSTKKINERNHIDGSKTYLRNNAFQSWLDYRAPRSIGKIIIEQRDMQHNGNFQPKLR